MAESLGYTTHTFTFDKLLAGHDGIVTKEVVIESGQNLSRGSLIGKRAFAVGTIVYDSGNTGNGTVSGVSMSSKVKKGNYVLECIAIAADSGTFAVYDPDGNRLSDATVGVAYTSEQINFTINDGSTDWAIGDKVTIPIQDGNGKYILSTSTDMDGPAREEYMAILAKDTDASSADVTTIAYIAGKFNENAITFGTGITAASVRHELSKRGIYLKSSVTG